MISVDLVTIANVPIVETGIEYPASTGPVTFTEDDLRDMVEAQDDPAIVAPRLKLGHTDPRFNGVILDGEPAFGVVKNLRLSNNDQTVVADYVGVPQWLANILPTAYPNRSIEGNWDVETVTGHKWRFVCTDVALLGVIWPGISTLDDLETTFSASGPEGVTVTEVAAAAPTSGAVWEKMQAALSASTNLEDVRRNFYDEYATQETGRYWWWVRAVLLDPNELIVDDDEGGLYRVPFTVNGETIVFDDPISVKIEYVDAPVAASHGTAPVLASTFASSQASRPANRQQEDEVDTPTATVDLAQLRRHLGLPEDATEDQINEALEAQADDEQEENDDETSTQEGGESGDQPSESGGEGGGSAPEPGTQAASGTVAVDSATLSQLQRDAALGRQAFEERRLEARDTFLSAAVKQGKFPPARLQHWKEAWERDPEGIKAAIDQMPAGLIPVAPLGSAPLQEGGNEPMYPSHWLPEVERQRNGGAIHQEA